MILPKLQGKESEMKRESLNTSILSHHFQSRSGFLKHVGGIYSHNGMTGCPRILVSDLNLGQFLHSMEFQCWKVNFRSEVLCKKSRSSNHNALYQRS